jgi:molybdate transport system substrate-binding protein
MKGVVRKAVACLALSTGLALGSVPPGGAQELTLSVAISLKDAVQEVGRRFAAARPGFRFHYNVGASGELQKQIEAGAPVDLFISAGERQMDALEAQGLILRETRRAVARNILTVVVPADSRLDLSKPADLGAPRVGKIAIGNPKTAPVGQYAEESLRSLGLWASLRPRLIFAENVRQALDYVARGEVDAGFVYVTDVAVGRDRVREAFRPPEDTYRPILYPAAVVTASRHAGLGRAFLDLLAGPEGRGILARFGFQAPGVKR